MNKKTERRLTEEFLAVRSSKKMPWQQLHASVYAKAAEAEMREARKKKDQKKRRSVSGPEKGQRSKTPRVYVTLDVFSGSPNPKWLIEPENHRLLLEKVNGLKPTKHSPSLPGLGYRGFLLENDGTMRGLPRTTRVFDGAVFLGDVKEAAALADGKGLEAWLMDLARTRGYGKLVDRTGRKKKRMTEG